MLIRLLVSSERYCCYIIIVIIAVNIILSLPLGKGVRFSVGFRKFSYNQRVAERTTSSLWHFFRVDGEELFWRNPSAASI